MASLLPPGFLNTIHKRFFNIIRGTSECRYGYQKSKLVRLNKIKVIKENGVKEITPQEKLQDIQKCYFQEKGLSPLIPAMKTYKIFDHLFETSQFTPKIYLKIAYDFHHVNFGNKILPLDACRIPRVTVGDHSFEFSDVDGKYFSFLMTNPDGNLFNPEFEVLHWLIMNIKFDRSNFEVNRQNVTLTDPDRSGKESLCGTMICPYLPPLPWQGTGDHRIVFVLLEQPSQLDVIQPLSEDISFQLRGFQTAEFIKTYNLTPVGIAWFQTHWDRSVNTTCLDILNMKEPIFDSIAFRDHIQRRRDFYEKTKTERYTKYLD